MTITELEQLEKARTQGGWKRVPWLTYKDDAWTEACSIMVPRLLAFVRAWDELRKGDEGRHVDPPCPACDIIREREAALLAARAALDEVKT